VSRRVWLWAGFISHSEHYPAQNIARLTKVVPTNTFVRLAARVTKIVSQTTFVTRVVRAVSPRCPNHASAPKTPELSARLGYAPMGCQAVFSSVTDSSRDSASATASS
jgi:hypothetical protein